MTKRKIYLKLTMLLMAMIFMVTGCQDELDSVFKENSLGDIKLGATPTIRTISVDQTGEKFNTIKNKLGLNGHLGEQLQTNNYAYRTTIDTLGLTIYTDVIKEITQGKYTSYTMLLVLPGQDGSKIYNLTIEDNDGKPGMFIVTYTPTDYWLDHKDEPYQGNITTQRISNLTNVGPEEGSDYDNQGPSSSYPTDCEGVVISTTVLLPYQCGCGHWPWQYCTGCGTASPAIPGYSNEYLYECFDSHLWDDNGTNNLGTGNPNTGGGNGLPGGSGDPQDTDPVSLTSIVGVTPKPPVDDCSSSEEDFNVYYSASSPFNVDLSAVSNCYNIDTEDVEENQKFMCIYNKLTQSPKFKNLFLDTFGESDNLNVKFTVVDSISGANGLTGLLPNSINNINQTTGEVNLNLLIKIDKSYMDSHSAIAVAKTIIHESIHAYLILKHVKCNVGTPFDEIMEDIDDKSLEELLNYYYDTACPNEEQHEFMFEHMIPTMSEILADIRDDLIPLSHQQNAEADMTFFDETNPTGPQVSWNWEQFYKYLSMAGLQNSDSFQWDIAPGSVKHQNYIEYTIDYGKNSFRKDCLD